MCAARISAKKINTWYVKSVVHSLSEAPCVQLGKVARPPAQMRCLKIECVVCVCVCVCVVCVRVCVCVCESVCESV